MDERWGEFTFDESQTFTNKFLNLPNSIMENICRFLTTRDQYNACLIHPNWTTAAQTVLWEKPRFETPASFRDFMNTIRNIRKVSLLVHDIYLIFLDHQGSIFQPIVKSNTERHGHESNALSSPNFLGAISKTCEHLKSLSFYGWHIEPSWIEKLPMLATELTSLYIIGGNIKSNAPLALSGLLSRLTSLRLDGAFTADDKWVDALVMRGKMIQQLQLPLQNIPVTTLSRICAPGGLTSLSDLTLTDADYLLDQHVKHIALSYPHLRKLCLEGTKQVTVLSIAHMFSTCPQLASLEIRAHFQSLDLPVNEHSLVAFNDLMMYNQNCAAPVRLLLENMNIDDDQLATLAPHLHLIQTLGFKSCPLVTSEGLKSTVESMKYLRIVHVLNCMNIDSGFFAKFAGMGNIVKTLYRIHFESSGSINPRHVYEICRAGIEYSLRQIRFVGYFELQGSAVGNFNEEYETNDDQSIVVLNRTSIDALAHSNDPEFSSIPEDRTLTGKQIIRLAKNLDITVQELLSMIDNSQESDYEDEDIVTEEEEFNKPRNSKSISFSNTAMDSDKSSSNNRLYALKHQNSSQRPTTPALWSNDFEENNVLYSDESQSEKSSNDETSGFTEEENTDEYADEEDDKEDKEEDDEGSNSPKWASLGPASAKNTGSEISLGGWGVTSSEGWVTHGKPHSSEHPIANPVIPRTVTPPPQQQQQQVPWTGYTEETYKDQWQQTGLEVNSKNYFGGRNKQKHFRNSPVVSDNDGWGSAQAIIPWDDVRAQGYVKDVIEEQKNTVFWTQTDEGNWKRAHDPTPKPTATKQVSNRDTASNGSPTLLFSDIASGLHNSKANQGIPITQSHRGKSNHPNHHSNRPAPAPSTPSRLRSDSLISSDGSVVWTDDSNAHIKLSSKEPSTTQTGNAAVTSSSSTPRFSTPKASEPTSRTKWSSADEWKNIKESSSTTDNAISEQSSWQDHFSPAVIADKTAKNEWKNFSRPRTSTPTRSSAPPREVDTRWGAFTNSNGNSISPPSRNSTSSPPRNSITNSNNYQKPSTPAAAPASQDLLVDTTNSATPTRPVLKGDVWESISSLDIPVTRSPQPVLVPQGASVTKPAPIPTEISSWSPLGSDSSKDQDDLPTFRFQETISGTITEQEVQDQVEARKNDNLVDFEDLISSSAPVMSPNFSHSSVLASPVPSNPKVSSDLLSMDQIETTTATAGTSSNHLTDFTSLMAEAKESVSKNTTKDTAAAKPIVADNLTAFNTYGTTSMNNADIMNDTKAMNTTTTTTTTTTAAADAINTTTTPAATATAAPLNDFSSLMSSSKPSDISSPASASGLNTPTYTNANASSKEDVAYTSDPSPRSTPEIQEKKPNLIKLRVQIEGKGSIQLALDCSKDFKEAIQNFCDEHGVPQYFEALHKQATDRWTARETKKILGKAKKKKVTSATPSTSSAPSSLF